MSDAQTHFLAHCPHCSAGLRIRRAYIGQQVHCNQCDQVFVVEERPDEAGVVPGETPAASPPAAQDDRIAVNCPGCQAALNVRRAYIGLQVHCNRCEQSFLVADPSARPPAGPPQDRVPGEDQGEKLREELERVRADRDRVAAENQRLQVERDRIRAEHEQLQASHRELEAAHPRLQASHAELRSAHDAMAAEVEEVKAARDRLADENHRLTGDRDRLQAEREECEREREAHRASEREARVAEIEEVTAARDRLATENERLASDRDRLQAERDGLQGERDEARAREQEARAGSAELRAVERELTVERDALRAERDRFKADRDAVHEALDGVAPGEVRPMAEERASLRAEVEALRSETERLRAEAERLQAQVAATNDRHSALVGSALERQQRWEADLADARGEVDRLAAAIQARDADLRTAHAERDRLRVDGEAAASEAQGHRETIERLEREHRERDEQSRDEIGRFRGEMDRLRGEIEPLRAEADRHSGLARDREEALAAALAEVERLRSDKEAAAAEAERLRSENASVVSEVEGLRSAIAESERERRERNGQDRADLARLRAEVEPLRLESDRLAGLVRDREAALAATAAERDRFSVERESAKVEAGRLRMSIHQLERDQLDRSEQERAEIERLAGILDQLRDENARLRARIDRCSLPAPSAAGGEELRAAQARVDSLQRELTDLRRVAAEMRGILAGIGIRFREI